MLGRLLRRWAVPVRVAGGAEKHRHRQLEIIKGRLQWFVFTNAPASENCAPSTIGGKEAWGVLFQAQIDKFTAKTPFAMAYLQICHAFNWLLPSEQRNQYQTMVRPNYKSSASTVATPSTRITSKRRGDDPGETAAAKKAAVASSTMVLFS